MLPIILVTAMLQQASTPRIQCDVTLPSWCVATFDGTIENRDTLDKRVWNLRLRRQVGDESLVVTEDKRCVDVPVSRPSVVYNEVLGGDGKFVFTSIRYASSGCSLEFKWPNGANSASYRQVVRFGIFVVAPPTGMVQVGYLLR